MMGERSGQVVLIVGGTGALGGAIARQLASEGADVAFTYRSNPEKAAALCADIEAKAVRSFADAVTLDEAERVATFVGEVIDKFGRIDTLVYASGPAFDLQYVAQIAPSDWSRVIASDLNGCFNTVSAALPHLRKTRGSIVAVTAAGIERAIARDVLSLAPKAAITALVRGIALEEGRYGVRANCIAPGYIAGGIGQAIMNSVGADIAGVLVKAVPLKRMGTVQEIADAASYVSSSRASYITGTTIFVSGGMEL